MPFEKGQSGNPGGRPKRINQAAHLARQYAEKAVERLAGLLDSDSEETRRKAAVDLLDRGFGKPKEFHEITGEDGGPVEIAEASLAKLPAATLNELLALSERLASDPDAGADGPGDHPA